MKNLYTAGCVLFLLFTALQSKAQADPPLDQHPARKPNLFSSLPNKFEFDIKELENLFNSSVSGKVLPKISKSLPTDASVTARVHKSERIESVNLKLAQYPGALFNLSRTNIKGKIQFTGRIVSPDHGDLLILVKENDRYFFIKQERQYTMTE